MKFVDLHCDTILECTTRGALLRENSCHIDIAKLKAGEALAQCFAIFVPTHSTAENTGVKETPYEYFQRSYGIFMREIEANKDSIRQARCYDEIMENQKNGLISAVLTLEDAVHLDGKIERVDELFEKGVRISTFTWNYENTLAYPCSREAEIMSKGLKPFGLEVLDRMNQLGIVVDVSHLSDGGFWDVAKHTKQPFVASHSDARALCDAVRNLTDDMLKALGEKGGVVGVNFLDMFLQRDAGGHTTIEMIVRHMLHLADKAGIAALAFGSDFDGIGSTLEFKDYSGMPEIARALEKHFKPHEIDKICSGNALRVFKECFKK